MLEKIEKPEIETAELKGIFFMRFLPMSISKNMNIP